jgi:hypothetical protein
MIILAAHGHTETLKVLASAFATLSATVLGACLAFWFGGLQSRKQFALNEAEKRLELTFEMHREFSGQYMMTARDDAEELLKNYPTEDYRTLYENHSHRETRCLFVVADFYERLALAIFSGRIDEALVPDLFGSYFIWWWVDVFRDRYVATDPNSPDSRRLVQLHDWIRKNSDPATFQNWMDQSRISRSAAPIDAKDAGPIRTAKAISSNPEEYEGWL